ncbi:MAG TPA: LamG-like jellyroll fold domain-containing protein, partial [Methylomirabilota bacterium]|nr:LamG-like jellyroll fold domain-containing protein [Methylomirabilota bacterium]
MKSRNSTCRQLARATASFLLIASAVAARADYSNTVAALNPLAYWRLSETTQPPAPNVATNSGTLGAAAIGYYAGNASHPVTGALAGNSDTAAGFDGSSGQTTVPFVPALGLNAPFSAELWVNPNTTASGLTCIMACGHFGGNRSGWLIYQDVNGYDFRMYNENAGNTSFDKEIGGLPVVGQWYHVVVTYDGTNASIYVNANKGTGVPSGFVANRDGPLTLGTRSDNNFYFNGNLDEVAIYTNALSDAEVLAHYQNGTNASRVTPYNTLIQAKNPIAYYRLNEPTYTDPDPGTLPVAVSSGTLGVNANAAIHPGTTVGVAGVPFSGFGAGNLACRFNGVIGYLDAGAPAEFDLLGPVSLVTWIKGNPADSRFQAFFAKSDDSYRLAMDQGGLAHFADAGDSDVVGTHNVNDGQWHLVVGVHDIFGTNYLYVDGQLEGTGPANATINSSSAHLVIGAAYDYLNSRVFAGSVDEPAIFDIALSKAQVQQIFNAGNVPARILTQPQAPVGAVYEGYTIPFTVVAAGTPTLAYQWTRNGTNLATKTTSALTLSAVTTNDSGNYAVIVTNNYGSVTSSIVALTVLSGPPQIFQQPQSITRYAGNSATFSVTAGGSTPLSYQWKLNGTTPIGGATASAYTINNVQAGNVGNYSCTITNPFGSTNTVLVSLAVIAAPTNAYAQAVLADHPIGYWRLGEGSGSTAFDYAGSHDGQYTNVVLGLPGYSINDTNTAAGFGPSIESRVANIPGIDFATNGANAVFSIECWVKGPQAQSGDVGILTKGSGAGGEQFNLDTGAGGHYR